MTKSEFDNLKSGQIICSCSKQYKTRGLVISFDPVELVIYWFKDKKIRHYPIHSGWYKGQFLDLFRVLL